MEEVDAHKGVSLLALLRPWFPTGAQQRQVVGVGVVEKQLELSGAQAEIQLTVELEMEG